MPSYVGCTGTGQNGTDVWRHVGAARITFWGHCPVCAKGLRVRSFHVTAVPFHKPQD